MNINRGNARLWFNIAYQWLGLVGQDGIRHAAVRRLVQSLRDNLENKNVDHRQVRECVERLTFLSDRLKDAREMADVRVECARAVFCCLGDPQWALQLLSDALEKYSSDHHWASVKWMMGTLQWLWPSRHKDAILSWEQSIERFQELAPRANNEALAQWYREVTRALQGALENALTGVMLPPPPWHFVNEALHAQDAEPVNGEEEGAVEGSLLSLFDIHEEIPAGGMGAVGADPHVLGAVYLDRVLIDGRFYRINSLVGERVIPLHAHARYMVLRVSGDSMNLAGIEDGDYVLVRQQDEAENGDIVAAEVIGVDTRATLKQYSRQGNHIILGPRSTNPEHQVYTFFEHDEEQFAIRGVVIAVFKPLER